MKTERTAESVRLQIIRYPIGIRRMFSHSHHMNVLASRIAPFLHHIESLGHKHQVLTLFNAAHVKHKSVGQSVTGLYLIKPAAWYLL